MALSVNEWASGMAKQVGRGVAHYRNTAHTEDGRKLTAQGLADRCTELGLPLERTVIAKLEKGMRQTITIGEMLILARALGVTPLELLFPIGRTSAIEILPGEQAEPWAAAKWFTGEASGLSSADGRPSGAQQDTALIDLFRRHDQAVQEWHRATRLLGRLRHGTGAPKPFHDDALDAARGCMAKDEEHLWALRQEIHDMGLTPPALPPYLSFLEGTQI